MYGMFAVSEDLVPPREQKAAGSSVIDFEGLLKTPLKMHEDLAEGCGGMLWPAGMVLSKYMLRQDADSLKDKSMFVCLQKERKEIFDYLNDGTDESFQT